MWFGQNTVSCFIFQAHWITHCFCFSCLHYFNQGNNIIQTVLSGICSVYFYFFSLFCVASFGAEVVKWIWLQENKIQICFVHSLKWRLQAKPSYAFCCVFFSFCRCVSEDSIHAGCSLVPHCNKFNAFITRCWLVILHKCCVCRFFQKYTANHYETIIKIYDHARKWHQVRAAN